MIILCPGLWPESTCIKLTRMDCVSYRVGLHMLAISSNRDHICLQCRKSSLSHVTMIFRRISRKENFDDCKHIWSVLKEIASIYSPFYNHDCKHNESPWLSWLEAYVIPYVAQISGISGPHHRRERISTHNVWHLDSELDYRSLFWDFLSRFWFLD